MDKPKKTYSYKLFRIRRDDKSTTLSMDPALATYAIRALGSEGAVTAFVRETAKQYDPAKHKDEHRSCSGYVSSMLTARVKQEASEPVPA